MKKYFYLLALGTILLILNGCMSTSHMKCPAFTARNISHRSGHTATAHYKHEKKDKTKTATATAPDAAGGGGGFFGFGGGAGNRSIEIKMPTMYANLKDDEIAQINEMFSKEAPNTVSIERKANNKVYLKANSPKEFRQMVKSIKKSAPAAAPHEGGGGGGIGLAAGILGIIGFVLAFGWYAGFLAFACAVAAIILGIIGLSGSRRGWAIVGIVLGILTLLLAFIFLHFIFIVV